MFLFTHSLQDIEHSKQEESTHGSFWTSLFLNVFNVKEYVCLLSKQYYGLYMSMFVKKQLVDQIEDLMYDKCSLDQSFLMNSKTQSLGLHFKVFGKSFCFINSRFVDGSGKTKQRNQNYQYFLENLKFKDSKVSDHK